MGITANVRRRLAIGVAGALLASALVAGIAPVAADDGQDVRPQNQAENQDRDATVGDVHFSITSLMVAPAVSFDAPVAAPLDNEARFIVEGKDDGK